MGLWIPDFEFGYLSVGENIRRHFDSSTSLVLRKNIKVSTNIVSQSISIQALLGTENHSGVAVWFPPEHLVRFEAIEKTYKDFPDSIHQDIFKYFAEFEKNKPKGIYFFSK